MGFFRGSSGRVSSPGRPGRPEKSRFFAAGLKLIGDGSVSATDGLDGGALRRGPRMISAFRYAQTELLDSAVRFCLEQGCQLSMHAMGTRAIDRMVRRAAGEASWTEEGIPYDAGGACDPALGREHAAGRGAWDRLCHPAYFPLRGNRQLPGRIWGLERLKQCYPVKTILDRGVTLGFSTDAPATFWAVPLGSFPGTEAGRYQAGGGGDRLRSRSGGDGGDSHTAVYQRGGPGCRD